MPQRVDVTQCAAAMTPLLTGFLFVCFLLAAKENRLRSLTSTIKDNKQIERKWNILMDGKPVHYKIITDIIA